MAHATSDHELEQRNRLPTLMEVLGRRTLAPVDLFSFYIYMRDQQRSVDYLDFWLDVSQHMSLCRHYVRELRRSMLIETPDFDKAVSKRSSQMLDNNIGLGDPASFHGSNRSNGSNNGKVTTDQRVSAMLRADHGYGKKSSNGSNPDRSPAGSVTSHQSRSQTQSQMRTTTEPKSVITEKQQAASALSTSGENPTDSQSPGHSVARADIRASAEKILYTYVLPGSEREIVLPNTIVSRIIHAVEEEGRDDPEVFDDAKDYVFQAMERDAFPGFLQAKALGNLVPLSVLIRLIAGLISLGAGFWAGYYLILTDASRSRRSWVILPYLIGCYLLVSYQYKLDFLAAYVGFSEYTFMNWSRVREPFVKKLLTTRASIALLMFITATVALCVLFIFVPGTNF